MYVVSYVDLQNFTLVDPMARELYVFVPCVTAAYTDKSHFIANKHGPIMSMRTPVKFILCMIHHMKYLDSPFTVNHSTILYELELDWDHAVEGSTEPLRMRLEQVHKRYTDYIEKCAKQSEADGMGIRLFNNLMSKSQKYSPS